MSEMSNTPQVKRGRGRPPGSKNKKTLQIREIPPPFDEEGFPNLPEGKFSGRPKKKQ